MYKILEKTQFSEKVFKFRIEAPAIAKHAHAGQFLMVRANETGERVPFTLAGWNGDEGWVEFIFMVIGKTTEMLSTYEAGESLRDVVGPLGVPTEMAEGPCAVIGGGVGLAIAFPVAKHLVETGHEVHAIMGARTKDLLLMEDQFRELLDEDHIHITTDDGSYGEQGVVTAPLERLLQIRRQMGLRNPAHSLVKLLDPFRGEAVLVAPATHPDFIELMRNIMQARGQRGLLLGLTPDEAARAASAKMADLTA